MPKEFEINKQVELAATPEQVWEAIATEHGLAAWFMPMPMDGDADGVVAWEPGERLRFETATGDDGSASAFEYLIEARDSGSTVLRFVHSGFISDDWGDEFESMTGHGWDMYFATLVQYFGHFSGRSATYIEAEGTESSASAAGWQRLQTKLSPPPPGLGDPVRIQLDGGPIDGTFDYVTPQFIGLRTDDALIRFHGRWPIGMAIAVSHHAYAPQDAHLDPAQLVAAWTQWLADL
jgi:uncharacterized protein YndB with AHSA1/START domain